jgi:hypothetical protein
MKYLIICIIACLFTVPAFADTTQSRDGDGQKIQGKAYGSIRSKSLGTKGNTFACFSTLNKTSWQIKVVATTTTDNAMLPFLFYYNSDSSVTYPITGSFEQWQNAPTSKSPTISRVCLKGYSTATTPVPKSAFGLFQ